MTREGSFGEPNDFISVDGNDTANVRAVNALVTELAQQGWEPLPGKGVSWYSYKFRRPVRT
jgi:hypothetical protein